MAQKKKFRLKRKTVTLEMHGDYEGGVIEVVSSTPISFALKILSMDTASADEQEALIREFGDRVLISWNFVDDETGDDIPATGEGVLSLDSETFNAVMEVWTGRVTVDSNLEQPPDGPDTSV